MNNHSYISIHLFQWYTLRTSSKNDTNRSLKFFLNHLPASNHNRSVSCVVSAPITQSTWSCWLFTVEPWYPWHLGCYQAGYSPEWITEPYAHSLSIIGTVVVVTAFHEKILIAYASFKTKNPILRPWYMLLSWSASLPSKRGALSPFSILFRLYFRPPAKLTPHAKQTDAVDITLHQVTCAVTGLRKFHVLPGSSLRLFCYNKRLFRLYVESNFKCVETNRKPPFSFHL